MALLNPYQRYIKKLESREIFNDRESLRPCNISQDSLATQIPKVKKNSIVYAIL